PCSPPCWRASSRRAGSSRSEPAGRADPMPESPRADRTVATNRRARHDYAIEETFEAGMVLTGPEVKSLRMGRATLTDAYARVDESGTGLWVENLHIPPYEMADTRAYEANGPMQLLVHR